MPSTMVWVHVSEAGSSELTPDLPSSVESPAVVSHPYGTAVCPAPSTLVLAHASKAGSSVSTGDRCDSDGPAVASNPTTFVFQKQALVN